VSHSRFRLLLLLLLLPFNGLFSRTTWVNRYQKGKTSLDLTEARDYGVWGRQWHQLECMQTICTSLQTDNHTSTSSLNFYRPDALTDAQGEGALGSSDWINHGFCTALPVQLPSLAQSRPCCLCESSFFFPHGCEWVNVSSGIGSPRWSPDKNPDHGYCVLYCSKDGWLGNQVVSVLDSSAEGCCFKSQPRRCRVTVLGKLFTPILPLFTKQENW